MEALCPGQSNGCSLDDVGIGVLDFMTGDLR